MTVRFLNVEVKTEFEYFEKVTFYFSRVKLLFFSYYFSIDFFDAAQRPAAQTNFMNYLYKLVPKKLRARLFAPSRVWHSTNACKQFHYR